MGLGGGPSVWEDYEWVRLPDLVLPGDPGYRQRTRSRRPDGRGGDLGAGDRRNGAGGSAGVVEPLARALADWLDEYPLWIPGAGRRVLLADLDNLRADPVRWRARMAAVVALARQADQAVLAGQGGAVARARPHLAEFADLARAVPDGSDLADHELLRGAAAVRRGARQVVVVSNDGIFAELAGRGPLVVLSPGRAALSSRLAEAAARVVDLADLEERVQLGRDLPRDVEDRGPTGPGPGDDEPADGEPADGTSGTRERSREPGDGRPGAPGTAPGSHAQPERDPGPVPEPVPEPETEPRSQPEGEPRSRPEAEPRSRAEAEPRPQAETEPQRTAGRRPEARPEPEPRSEPGRGIGRPGPVPVLEFRAPDGGVAVEFLAAELMPESGPGRSRRRPDRERARAGSARRRPR